MRLFVSYSLWLFLHSSLVMLISCNSLPNKNTLPLRQKKEEYSAFKDLRRLEKNHQWEEIIVRLSLEENFEFSKKERDSLRKIAIEEIKKERQEAWEKEDYKKAWEKGESLSVLGLQLNDPNQNEVVESYLQSSLKRNKAQAEALALFFYQKGYVIAKPYLSSVSSQSSSKDWLKGILTLIVDQGFRLNKGMGIPSRTLGSAFVIHPQGYAITNYHVISSEVDKNYKGYSQLYARLPGGKGEKLKADVIGYNKESDLALIKIHFPTEFFFSLEQSGQIDAGQPIYALGSPLGLEETITSGIVSAKSRRILSVGESFQIDAAINQGSSGGPILDTSGRVIGMAFSGVPGYQGINFAIPASWISLHLPFLYEKGSSYSGWLGMSVSESLQGIEVVQTISGGPAEGVLQVGDKLISLNNRKISSIADYQREIITSKYLYQITYQREGQEMTSLIYPQERPEEPLKLAFERMSKRDFLDLLLGIESEEGSKSFFSQSYRLKKVFPNMLGDELGLNVNDYFELYHLKLDSSREFFTLDFLIKKQVKGFFASPLGIRVPLAYPYFI